MRIKCFSSMLLVCIISVNTAMAYSLEDVQKATNGYGVFTVTINNRGNCDAGVYVSVDLINHPKGYEKHVFSFSRILLVKARSSVDVSLLKPLAGIFPDYKGIGPKLLNDSQVEVLLSDGGGQEELEQFYFYPAEYVQHTKFIEVPNTTFDINFDNLVQKIENDQSSTVKTSKISITPDSYRK